MHEKLSLEFSQYVLYQKRVSRTGTSNDILQYLWDVVICSCPGCLPLLQYTRCMWRPACNIACTSTTKWGSYLFIRKHGKIPVCGRGLSPQLPELAYPSPWKPVKMGTTRQRTGWCVCRQIRESRLTIRKITFSEKIQCYHTLRVGNIIHELNSLKPSDACMRR